MRALLLAGRTLAGRRGGDLGEEAGGDSVLLLPSRSRPYVCKKNGRGAQVRWGSDADQLEMFSLEENCQLKYTLTDRLGSC